ncbi:ABC transporter ATP-binding protein [Pseudaminobacter soli (ex Li et al. 2025)]|uniref:ABC transporter ATP-binding protein n=1 Tax=Pseudaminobacter soli (ex Li et al. 2025) TaxID=1295366 RepID=A0A2P7S3W7_9HYPH|nr:ABC transporter ATP-binding protein [Mesorhizobium soli]PSJ57131.1 ABC transporter ATP-binding protein [Mesorhizobium soli]
MIEIESVSVDFHTKLRTVRALKDVSLSVPQGTVFGLVGESGSGKTTLLRAMMGLTAVSSGGVKIAGEAVRQNPPLAFRRRVQMVMQDCYASLNPAHTVDQIIGEPLAIHRFDNPEKRILQALKDVGLGPEHRFRFPHQLSGGQRQRVAIARCLAIEPQVMLLDEPTSALDVSIQAEIVNLVMRLQQQKGLTLFIISHDLPLVTHMCDRLAIMRKGMVREVITSQDLIERKVEDDYTKVLLSASL